MIEPIPRTVEEAVKVGPFAVGDWLIILVALLIPRMAVTYLRDLYLLGISWENILQFGLGGAALLLLKFKTNRPRGFFASVLLYAARPNRY
jgi:hypothetical protein